MRFLSNISSIGFGIKTPLVAVEGSEPYTYSILTAGSGGSINSSTGIYTASNIPGIDVVQVEDSIGDKETLEMNVLSPLGLLCDVIKTEMNLEADQVYIYNQTFRVPQDNRIYVAVSVGSLKPFSNNIRPSANGGNLSGEQYANFVSTHGINLVSANEDALYRKEELLMTFVSFYSQNQQSANNFHIAPMSSQFTNLSELEGERIPYRFHIDVNLNYVFRKVQNSPFYDTFQEPIVTTNP